MKNKLSILPFSISPICISLLCIFILSSSLSAAEPDESGIGGTGHSSEAETLLELFHKPDLPERVNLPDIILTPDIPDLEANVGGSTVPSADTSTTTGGAAGSAPPP